MDNLWFIYNVSIFVFNRISSRLKPFILYHCIEHFSTPLTLLSIIWVTCPRWRTYRLWMIDKNALEKKGRSIHNFFISSRICTRVEQSVLYHHIEYLNTLCCLFFWRAMKLLQGGPNWETWLIHLQIVRSSSDLDAVLNSVYHISLRIFSH